jgi:hypothetical protein
MASWSLCTSAVACGRSFTLRWPDARSFVCVVAPGPSDSSVEFAWCAWTPKSRPRELHVATRHERGGPDADATPKPDAED